MSIFDGDRDLAEPRFDRDRDLAELRVEHNFRISQKIKYYKNHDIDPLAVESILEQENLQQEGIKNKVGIVKSAKNPIEVDYFSKELETTTTVGAYLQKSRNHMVVAKVTRTKDNINIELIDSKGGASKRPEAEYSSNPIKRFGQKISDKVGGLVDKVVSTVVGNIELIKIKKEFQKQNPDAKITTKLTKLETQHGIDSGRHVIENIKALANGNEVETNFEKANTSINIQNYKTIIVQSDIKEIKEWYNSMVTATNKEAKQQKQKQDQKQARRRESVPANLKANTTTIGQHPKSLTPTSTSAKTTTSKGQGIS